MMNAVPAKAPFGLAPDLDFHAVSPASTFDLQGLRQPTVFRRLAADWPAVRSWSIERLADRAPDIPVKLVAGNRERDDTHFVSSTLRDYLRTLKVQGIETTGPPLYLKEFDLLKAVPDLRQDLRYESLLPRHAVSSVQSWVGPAGARTGLHYDYPDNVAVQLVGTKRFCLVKPGVVEHLGAVSEKYDSWAVLARGSAQELAARWNHSASAIDEPAFFTVDLHPGDVLFIPARWWHEVTNLSHGISFGGFFGGYAQAALVQTWVGARDLAHRWGWLGRGNCTCHPASRTNGGAAV